MNAENSKWNRNFNFSCQTYFSHGPQEQASFESVKLHSNIRNYPLPKYIDTQSEVLEYFSQQLRGLYLRAYLRKVTPSVSDLSNSLVD